MPLRLPPARVFRIFYALGLGPVVGRLVLLLTTRGRRSGRLRVTPLQYEEIDGDIVVGSSRGTRGVWHWNILADPQVRVRVGSRAFHGIAEPTTDPRRIADFLQVRLDRHPRMVRAILRSEGLPEHPGRSDLEMYASKLVTVVIRSLQEASWRHPYRQPSPRQGSGSRAREENVRTC